MSRIVNPIYEGFHDSVHFAVEVVTAFIVGAGRTIARLVSAFAAH